jgi:hypothetical protein
VKLGQDENGPFVEVVDSERMMQKGDSQLQSASHLYIQQYLHFLH